MNDYEVTFTGTLQLTVPVRADSREQAEREIRSCCTDDFIIREKREAWDETL